MNSKVEQYQYEDVDSAHQIFPFIDGHFWVERDHRIIDPYFYQYDIVKRLNRLEGKAVYLEADIIISKVIIRRFESEITKALTTFSTLSTTTDLFAKIIKDGYKNTFGRCYQNAILEISKNGGRLCFGSMGWKHKKNDSIHWEFGGENWKVSQFIKSK